MGLPDDHVNGPDPLSPIPSEDPPPVYSRLSNESLECQVATVAYVCDSLCPVRFHSWSLHKVGRGGLEDARRSLALRLPIADSPREVRNADANAWLSAQNEWLMCVKRDIGCGMHELFLPPLQSGLSEGARNGFISEYIYCHNSYTAKRKAGAANAIARGATAALQVQEAIIASGNPNVTNAQEEARRLLVALTAATRISAIFQDSELLRMFENAGSTPRQRSVSSWYTAARLFHAMAATAYAVAQYQLFIAQQGLVQQKDISSIESAVQEAARALNVVCMTGIGTLRAHELASQQDTNFSLRACRLKLRVYMLHRDPAVIQDQET